ncbi:MAG TPA: Rieske 2Fe-2S domain-containing protein [Planctomycetota bacterium]|nr:Rieske 2Fe-2S domain-containing protein [Planctomycetota bacterium]
MDEEAREGADIPAVDPAHEGPPGGSDGGPPRRTFLTKLLAATIGAVVAIIPAAVGLFVALEPLRRRRGKDGAPFIPVASLDAVPPDGMPRLFRVIADRQDAWNRHPKVPVGAVYLRRSREKPEEILALHTTCPHLGCFVNAKPDGSFHCPCHDSSFNSDGSIASLRSPSPRGLDPLPTRTEKTMILVQFQDFETGLEDRVPIL